jgi:hypothetical protein
MIIEMPFLGLFTTEFGVFKLKALQAKLQGYLAPAQGVDFIARGSLGYPEPIQPLN